MNWYKTTLVCGTCHPPTQEGYRVIISVDLLDYLLGCFTLVTLPFDLFIRVYARSPRRPLLVTSVVCRFSPVMDFTG
jgi:hypothetical protein